MDRRHFLLAAGAVPSAASATESPPHLQVDGYLLCRAFQATIEYAVTATSRGLRIVAACAASAHAGPADWVALAPLLAIFGRASPALPSGWLALPDGTYRSTFDDAPAPDNLKEFPFFRDLMAGQEVAVVPRVSAVSGQRVFVTAVPVIRQGRIIAAVGVETPARTIMEAVDASYRLPPNLFYVVFNDAGLIVLHTEHNRIFQTPDMSDPSMAAAIRRVLSEEEGAVTYRARGTPRLAVFNRSARLGWRFMVAETVVQ